MKRLGVYFVIAFFLGLHAPRFTATAQDRPLKKIYWGVSTLSPTLWIPWISKEAKLFEKNGLDVEPVLLNGSGRTSQALLSGSLFAASVALPQVMLAVLNGADLVNVAHGIGVQSSRLMVKPEIRKVEDLKGKKIGISSLGLGGRFALRLRAAQVRHRHQSRGDLAFGRQYRRPPPVAVNRFSRRRGSDLSVRRAGGAQRVSRSARCAKRNHLSDQLRGDPEKDDPRRPRYRDAFRQVVCRRHRISQEQQRIQSKSFGQISENQRSGIFGRIVRDFQEDFIAAPYPITKGLDAIYEIAAARRPEIRSHKPEEFVDTSFVAELEKSGFIKKLYEGNRQ